MGCKKDCGSRLSEPGPRSSGSRSVKVAPTINDDGTVRDVTPVQSEGITNDRLLYEAVRQNLLRWTFEKRTTDNALSPILTYTFKIEGATREGVKQQFVFERPGAVIVTSEGYCSDHFPCNEEEVKEWLKSRAERK